MKPGSVRIIDRVSAVEAIKRLNEEDLLFLNLPQALARLTPRRLSPSCSR